MIVWVLWHSWLLVDDVSDVFRRFVLFGVV